MKKNVITVDHEKLQKYADEHQDDFLKFGNRWPADSMEYNVFLGLKFDPGDTFEEFMLIEQEPNIGQGESTFEPNEFEKIEGHEDGNRFYKGFVTRYIKVATFIYDGEKYIVNDLLDASHTYKYIWRNVTKDTQRSQNEYKNVYKFGYVTVQVKTNKKLNVISPTIKGIELKDNTLNVNLNSISKPFTGFVEVDQKLYLPVSYEGAKGLSAVQQMEGIYPFKSANPSKDIYNNAISRLVCIAKVESNENGKAESETTLQPCEETAGFGPQQLLLTNETDYKHGTWCYNLEALESKYETPCNVGQNGCAQCNEDSTLCTKCESNYGFNETDGTCTECTGGQISDGTGPCQNPPPACKAGENGCKTCSEDGKICAVCINSDFEIDGITCKQPVCKEGEKGCKTCNDDKTKCTNCTEEGYIPDGITCKLDCSSIANCDVCEKSTDSITCTTCKNGFTLSEDKKSCLELAKCDIVGCLGCLSSNLTICHACNEEDHFELTDDGKCECAEGYDFTDNKCLKDLILIPLPPEVPSKTESVEEKDGVLTVPEEKPEEGIYYLDLSNKDTNALKIINEKYQDVLIKLPSGEGKTFTITPEKEDTNAIISCPPKTTLVIASNSKIDVQTEREVTINAPEGTDDLTLNSLIPRSDEFTLKSKNNLILNTLQIFDKRTVIGESLGENKDITIKEVQIEQKGEFTPEGLTIEKINIGVGSVLKLITGSKELTNTDILVYYNRTQVDGHPLNLDGYQDIEKPPKSIRVQTKSAIESVESLEVDDFILTEVPFGGEEENRPIYKEACENWKNSFRAEKEFNNCECKYVNDKDEVDNEKFTKVQLVSSHVPEKTPKKKKLSAGAIAGIVIACVVVVAAIIALLVYFLVIKKRNNTTESTQGDSSIAI